MRYVIAGAGVSGLGAARLLEAAGEPFVVADDSDEGRARAEALGYTTVTGTQARASFADFDTVVTSPGWRPDSPLLIDASG